MAQPPIFIDIGELSGVDAETYAAADAGDRQAQKLMLRNLMTRNASPLALISGDWTDWVLRMIATGSQEATSDALGSIAEAARKGEMSAEQKAALDELFEQYFGPGVVGVHIATRAMLAFATKDRALEVLQLFLLADRLGDGDPSVSLDEIDAALERAHALQSPAAEAYFMAIRAQNIYQTDIAAGFNWAVAALRTVEPLAGGDPIYTVKIGQLALFASQLAQIAGEDQASLLLRTVYVDQIQRYTESQ
jgi:hypothetical protein